MASSADLHDISRTTVKPYSPTPPHLKTYNLPYLDQATRHAYISILLFYPNVDSDFAENLKISLSHTLTRYYPFAGKIRDGGAAIDCTDDGVDFVQATSHCCLSDFLRKPDADALEVLYPDRITNDNSWKGGLVMVQVTFFAGGGAAVGVCMSHKLGDACTLSTFLASWAAAARQCETAMAVPFLSDAVGETEDLPESDTPVILEAAGEKRRWVTRRLMFDAAKIAELKDVVVRSGMKNPTSVEVVTSLFCKCAMAASKAKCGYSKPVVMIQMVNLRSRVNPPLPENLVGNFSWGYMLMPTENTLDGLAGALRKSLEDFCDKYTKDKDPKQCYSLLIESMKATKSQQKKREKTDQPMEVDLYKGSSFSRYPFGEMDFGSGKPVWAAIGSILEAIIRNTMHLIDAPNGKGLEAWVSLEEEVMALFERDEELLAFASVNPSVMN